VTVSVLPLLLSRACPFAFRGDALDRRLMEFSMIRTGELSAIRAVKLITKKALVVLVTAIGFAGSLVLMASAANAQDPRSAASMAALKDKTAKLGAPRIEGTEDIGGKSVPVLYFGSTKMNNNFTLVDEVAKEGGPGMTVTLFVKAGLQLEQHAPLKEYIRVATSVVLPDGTRAVGTVMGSGARLDKRRLSLLWRSRGSWHGIYDSLRAHQRRLG